MLEDVLQPPESHFPEDFAVAPASFFDFPEDDVLLAETLSNPPEVCSSNCSGDTLFSSSSPSADSNRYTLVLAAPCHGLGARQPPGVDFTTSYAPELIFRDMFGLSTLHHLSSSSYEDNAAGTGPGHVLGQVGVSVDTSSPTPRSFGPPFEAEVECLLPFIDFAQATPLGVVQPGWQSPTTAAARERSFRPVNPIESGIMASKLEIHAERLRGVLAEPVLAVYNDGDMQGQQEKGQVVGGGGCGTTLTSDTPALEESGFKVGRYSMEERKQRIRRYMKKRNKRNFNKKIKYACRKTLADSRPRVRGRFAKNDDFIDASGTHHFEDDDEVDVADYKEQDLIDSANIFAHISGVNSFDTNCPIQSWF